MMTIIRTAQTEDLVEMKNFLGQAEVSTSGIEHQLDHFILMEDIEGGLLGTLGIQRLEHDGLLRSLVISPKVEKTKILDMFQQILSLAKKKELKCLYLATNKIVSVEFFTLLGFKRLELNEVPPHIFQSEHVEESLQMGETVIMRFII
ncbi:GNAT family N-acetyltransferase [Bacillus salitolerans]|uniref:GNAT family N-acetyltransferase n=1 Tax=Bacillus salitolerans TaxID=1437434 RepID=A0ABW4LMH7_9BACI